MSRVWAFKTFKLYPPNPSPPPPHTTLFRRGGGGVGGEPYQSIQVRDGDVQSVGIQNIQTLPPSYPLPPPHHTTLFRRGGRGGGGGGEREPYHSIQLGDRDAQSVGQLGGGEERLQTAVDVGEQVCHVRAAKLLKLGLCGGVEGGGEGSLTTLFSSETEMPRVWASWAEGKSACRQRLMSGSRSVMYVQQNCSNWACVEGWREGGRGALPLYSAQRQRCPECGPAGRRGRAPADSGWCRGAGLSRTCSKTAQTGLSLAGWTSFPPPCNQHKSKFGTVWDE